MRVLLQLDLFDLMPLGCVVEYDFLTSLVARTVTPLAQLCPRFGKVKSHASLLLQPAEGSERSPAGANVDCSSGDF